MAIRLDPEDNEIVALASLVPSFAGCRVLEVGCGDGRLTRRYAGHAAAVLAIDPDEAAIASCLGDPTSAPIEFRAISFEQLVLPDRSFDVVLFSWAL